MLPHNLLAHGTIAGAMSHILCSYYSTLWIAIHLTTSTYSIPALEYSNNRPPFSIHHLPYMTIPPNSITMHHTTTTRPRYPSRCFLLRLNSQPKSHHDLKTGLMVHTILPCGRNHMDIYGRPFSSILQRAPTSGLGPVLWYEPNMKPEDLKFQNKYIRKQHTYLIIIPLNGSYTRLRPML